MNLDCVECPEHLIFHVYVRDFVRSNSNYKKSIILPQCVSMFVYFSQNQIPLKAKKASKQTHMSMAP